MEYRAAPAPTTAAAAPRFSRRRLLGAVGALGLTVRGTAACSTTSNTTPGQEAASSAGIASGGDVTAPAAKGVLGVNYNQDVNRIDFAQLQAASASWLRAFYTTEDATARTGLPNLLNAADHGYGTVLTLKFQYQNQPLPTPGSTAMDKPIAELQSVMTAAMDKVDIIVIGNEPFYETTKADRSNPRINEFYEALAQYAIAHHGQSRTQLYMGALTGLEDSANQTPETDRWVNFVAQTPQLAGVDIHPHVSSMANAKLYVDYVLARLRPDQKYLATEFSLVKLWKQHMTDLVDSGFAAQYGLPSGTLNWQVLQAAIEHPLRQQEWNDFLTTATWLQAHRTFLTDQIAAFRRTGRLAVAGYGISQDQTHLDATTMPWALNSLFCPRTVQSGAGGLPGENPIWLPEYRAAQQR